MKKTVVIGLLGTTLDRWHKEDRWSKWRPTVSIFQHQDFLVHRLELLHSKRDQSMADHVLKDIHTVSPETEARSVHLEMKDAWDFEEVYGVLHDYARNYPFDLEKEDYYLHITTGSHVAQICLFLLTEAKYFPAKLLQTSPPQSPDPEAQYRIIDLDLSQYDKLASRFVQEKKEGLSFLKSGINTRNATFNRLVEEIEQVAIQSKAPILLSGPTGTGKTQLARRIYELKKMRHQIQGDFMEVNCATLQGDTASSALFGHVKGAFTGAVSDRAGLLKKADKGVLFLDEIGELGLDQQAMLLRALEDKTFLPLGTDSPVKSDFQLMAGTNRDLRLDVVRGKFRKDLLARIDLWAFELPSLAERPEDLEPNLQFEMELFAERNQKRVTFSREAQEKFLAFARRGAQWKGNFRDFNAAVTRMATLAPGGRITEEIVGQEMARLKNSWSEEGEEKGGALAGLLTPSQLSQLDRFDLVQLEEVVAVCRSSSSLSEAGRRLFAVSRTLKKAPNDADRLKKYLQKHHLTWDDLNRLK